ncbi:MAG: hypothetical protein LUQ38_02925 [Methanotrichaceae archaeon]|nr:hypothetical protein [Methanotrichaceae archaeon]
MKTKSMVSSSWVVPILTVFLLLGVVLASLIMQPRASSEAWDIKESDFPANGSSEEKLTFLLRYAILAPSSHNTQSWRFKVNDSEIKVFADKNRWLSVADADQRELYISVGCALENLLVAAEHFGYGFNVTYFPKNGDEVALVKLHPDSSLSVHQDPRLFQSILIRHTNRMPYESKKDLEGALLKLRNYSADHGIQLYSTSDPKIKNAFRDLVVDSDLIQYSDVDYKSELGHWIGQGVMGPTGINAIIAQLAVVLLDMGKDQIKKDADLVNDTPVLGFVISKENDRESQVRSGQTFERIWLEATALGISIHPMSQALEVPGKKEELTKLITGSDLCLQQAFRLGYAEPLKENTPRRPLEDFLI